MLFSAFGTKKCTKTPVNLLASNMNTLCFKVICVCELGLGLGPHDPVLAVFKDQTGACLAVAG